MHTAIYEHLLEEWNAAHELLILRVGAEAHHPLHSSTVVPAAIKEDHLPRRRQVLDVFFCKPISGQFSH